jgi:hypothetical protein
MTWRHFETQVESSTTLYKWLNQTTQNRFFEIRLCDGSISFHSVTIKLEKYKNQLSEGAGELKAGRECKVYSPSEKRGPWWWLTLMCFPCEGMTKAVPWQRNSGSKLQYLWPKNSEHGPTEVARNWARKLQKEQTVPQTWKSPLYCLAKPITTHILCKTSRIPGRTQTVERFV